MPIDTSGTSDIERRSRPAPADEADRIDVEKEGRSAALVRLLRVEDVRGSERQRARVYSTRVLVQEEAEISGRRLRECDGQEHVVVLAASRRCYMFRPASADR
jgi:hypothetical protein